MTSSQEIVLSRLAVLTGDLQPTEHSTPSDLAFARSILAQVLTHDQVEPVAKPAIMRQLAEAESAAMTQPRAADELLPHVKRAQAATTPPEFLIHRREVPVLTTQNPGSLPPWAAGREIERTLGPFRDAMGRFVWFDLFRIVRQFNLVRTLGSAPFLTVPLRGLVFGGTQFRLGPGSIWFASQLVAPSAPPGGYTGLRIKGGTLTFSQAVSATGTDLIVPPGVTCTLDAQLDAPAPQPGSLQPRRVKMRARPP